MTAAHFWDFSAVAALDTIVARLRRDGRNVEMVGYNHASAYIIDRFALHTTRPAWSSAPFPIELKLIRSDTCVDLALSDVRFWCPATQDRTVS